MNPLLRESAVHCYWTVTALLSTITLFIFINTNRKGYGSRKATARGADGFWPESARTRQEGRRHQWHGLADRAGRIAIYRRRVSPRLAIKRKQSRSRVVCLRVSVLRCQSRRDCEFFSMGCSPKRMSQTKSPFASSNVAQVRRYDRRSDRRL